MIDGNEVALNDDFEQELDDIFFKNHGVGDTPEDQEMARIGNHLNPNFPTFKEIEFCKMIANGVNKKEAYIKAFGYNGNELKPKSFESNARRLLERPRVGKYLYDLQEKMVNTSLEDVHKLVDELNEDRKLARDLGQPGAAIQAVKTKAGILGLEQKTHVHYNISDSLSEDQREQLLKRIGRSSAKNTENNQIIDAEFTDITDE